MKALQQAWLANDLEAFAIALGIVLAVMVVLWIARRVAARALFAISQRTANVLDDIAADTVRSTNLVLLLPLAVHAGGLMLELPQSLSNATALAASVGVVLQAGMWAARIASEWIHARTKSRGADGAGLMAMSLLGFAARAGIWSLVLLVVLGQLGINITGLVAGLGIGGIAIALAVQNILSDLFASLSIVLDRPFVVGDFIVVDGLRGAVESVGVKTTRVRSLDGEMLVFANSDLLKSRIRNFQAMNERRVSFAVGATYGTDPAKVREIPGMLRDAVEAQPRTRFDRAHFKEYADSSLAFEVVYYVLDRDYNFFMDVQQAINLAILERFTRERIEFAYPTRTLYIAGAIPAAGVQPNEAAAELRPRERGPTAARA